MDATHTGPLEAGKAWLRERVERGLHPVDGLDRAAALETIERLSGLEPEPWTAAWGALAEGYAAQARAAAEATQRHHLWEQAYQAAFLGRYPVPNHPLKAKLYERGRGYFLEAAALEQPPLEVVDVPFAGRPDEGDNVRFYLTRPGGVERPRVVLAWGGIDTWKEESHARLGALLRVRGLAVVLIDIPGTGESPVLASADAERQYTPVFDYLAARTDLDGSRCGVIGASFGGYWSMKLAYTHRDHVTAAVNWGGGVHITFTRAWQERSRHATSYLMDLMAARARIFGGSTFQDYVERCHSCRCSTRACSTPRHPPSSSSMAATINRTRSTTSTSASTTATPRRPVCSTAATWVKGRLSQPSSTGCAHNSPEPVPYRLGGFHQELGACFACGRNCRSGRRTRARLDELGQRALDRRRRPLTLVKQRRRGRDGAPGFHQEEPRRRRDRSRRGPATADTRSRRLLSPFR